MYSSISLWSTGKKKPIFNYPLAHGVYIHESETEGQVKVPRWVTSLTCLRYSDLFASGGFISPYKLTHSPRAKLIGGYSRFL